MSVATIFEVTCEGCGRSVLVYEHASEVTARQELATEGWVRYDGADICPKCAVGEP